MHTRLLLAFITLLASVAPSVARAEVDKNAASLVTELVTTSLGKEARFDVLSSSDVRRQLELEANRATLGCDSASTSCLAEIAGAMGAQLVVYGKLGTLDDVVILTLNLFDSTSASAVGRVAVKEKSLSALSDRVEPAVQELIAPFAAKFTAEASAAQLAPGGKVKLLVLDIEPPEKGTASGPTEAPAADAPSAFFWGGIGGLVGGAVAVGVGVGLGFLAQGKTEDAKSAPDVGAATQSYDERDLLGGSALVAIGLGSAGIVAGAILLLLPSE